MKPRLIGKEPLFERNVFLLSLESIATQFATLFPDAGQFVCLTAIDARGISDEAFLSFCSHMLRLGCAYFCAWGPDGERVHDLMDRVVVGDNPPGTYAGCLMTTWHDNELLEDAADFLLTCAIPDEDYAPIGCQTALIITVGSDAWAGDLERHVGDRTKRPTQ